MRGKRAQKRTLEPDAAYKSVLVTRFINYLMLDGKKGVARKIVYSVLEKLNEDKKEALKEFEKAIKKVMPEQEVRSRRVGGATYQVPMPVKHDRAESLAIRWIISSARAKKGTDMTNRLYTEFKAILKGEGSNALKKRQDVEKMAESNKAFAHFKW